MIFAAGLGTRLRPLTDTCPKALVEVAGRPLLEHTVMRLREAGADRIVVNVHHFAEQIRSYLRANGNFGMDIRVSDETERLLDTGGGIRKAAPLFDPSEPILIHNVDILSNVDLRRFYDENRDAEATLLVSCRQTKRYLLFAKDENHRLMGWVNIETGERKGPYPGLDPQQCDMYAFSGIHLFSPALFPLLNEMPEKFGIIDFYLRHCADHNIRGCAVEGLRLMDVGKADTLAEADGFVRTISAATMPQDASINSYYPNNPV